MSDDKPAREPIPEDARIDALEERLKAAREREEKRNLKNAKGPDAGERQGNQALSYLIGGPLGGAVIGWGIDTLFDVSPWGLLVGLSLGTFVAFRNIFRMAGTQTPPSDEG